MDDSSNAPTLPNLPHHQSEELACAAASRMLVCEEEGEDRGGQRRRRRRKRRKSHCEPFVKGCTNTPVQEHDHSDQQPDTQNKKDVKVCLRLETTDCGVQNTHTYTNKQTNDEAGAVGRTSWNAPKGMLSA